MSIISLSINHILVVIYSSFISLLSVGAILFILRIRDSNIKILFFFLPLIKPFFILLEDFNINSDFFVTRPGTLGFRFPSPNTILSRIDKIESSPFNSTNINITIIFLLLLITLVILIIRWINLYIFYRNLAYEEKVNPEDIPKIYLIVNKFAQSIGIKPPQISLTHRNYYNPFVIGIKNHLIVLSPTLIDSLSFSEKEILIEHELSHIKRRDNLIGWLALILRDLLFFNPFAHIAYSLIKLEQEIGSDKIILEFSGYSSKEIARNIINLILKIKQKAHNKDNNSELYQNAFYKPLKKIGFLILNYRIKSILNTNNKKIRVKKITRIFLFMLFLFLLLIQIVLIVKMNNSLLLLR